MRKNQNRHDELRIKASLLNALRADGALGSDTLIASEFRLPHLGVRADLALLDEAFVGVEVKSPLDTTRRLDRQMWAYLQVFDKVLLVVPQKHDHVTSMPQLKNVEVWLYDSDGSLRQLKRSFAMGGPRRGSLLSLVPPSQLSRLHAFEASPSEEPEFALFKRHFAHRFGATSSALWRTTRRREIRPVDLTRLSRFADSRSRRTAAIRQQENFWAQWHEQAERLYKAPPRQSIQSSSVS
jgi:hypothetical protein